MNRRIGLPSIVAALLLCAVASAQPTSRADLDACAALALAASADLAPAPAPAPPVKTCPCGPLCTCGCNEGLPCQCGEGRTVSVVAFAAGGERPSLPSLAPAPVLAPPVRPVPSWVEGYAPAQAMPAAPTVYRPAPAALPAAPTVNYGWSYSPPVRAYSPPSPMRFAAPVFSRGGSAGC